MKILYKKVLLFLSFLFFCLGTKAVSYNADTLVVAKDGSGDYKTIARAIEACRCFMDYHKVIYIKEGVYREKVVIPSWMRNIELCGEDSLKTIITFDDHARIKSPETGLKIGTFRTYTLKIEGNDITIKNLSIENCAKVKTQAVALHTEGDRIKIVGCHLLGNVDTFYAGMEGTRVYLHGCYIEGTLDFIFGPATVWFEQCQIHSKSNSFVTAASTPKEVKYGFVFNRCRLTAATGVDKAYLGRPWRPHAHTLFMNCEIGGHILDAGWKVWSNKESHQTTRYEEYNNTGRGANCSRRVEWSKQLTKREAGRITVERVFALPSLEWIISSSPFAP